MDKFVNLHCHSEYSMLDGMSRISEIVEYGKKNSGIACITDHRTCAGWSFLDTECKKQEVKPIFGVEVNITENVGIREDKGHHLCLYAMNKKGIENICKLVTMSNSKGFYYVPRIDYDYLEAWNEGIIVSSACLASDVSNLIKQELNPEGLIDWYANLFKDRYFIEFQNHGFYEEGWVMDEIKHLADRKGLPVIATVDSHYTKKEDEDIHRVLLAMNYKKSFKDVEGFTGNGYHLLSDVELLDKFSSSHLTNTMELANKVEEGLLDFEIDKSPKFHLK